MFLFLSDIRRNPLLWLLVFVPVDFVVAKVSPHAYSLVFILTLLAIVPLAGLLSDATESVAAKTVTRSAGCSTPRLAISRNS